MCGDLRMATANCQAMWPTLNMVLTSRLKITSMNERRHSFIEIGKQNDESKCENVIVNNAGLSNKWLLSKPYIPGANKGWVRKAR